jgi:hypothetical protein
MTGLETNVFPITNLADLSASYRLYRVRGLGTEQAEFFRNRDALVRHLSYRLNNPVTTVNRDGQTYLALRDDADPPPSPVPLVRATAYLDPVPGVLPLNFAVATPETDPIRRRFLQFMLQAPLRHDAGLWQPAAGYPFYERVPVREVNGLCLYRGFSVRVVPTADGGLGLCVDVKHKYVTRVPLPVRLTREQFRRYRGRHCVYHYGHQWFDIQLAELSDLNAEEYLIERGDWRVPLLTFISEASRKPIPPELAGLPHNAAVVLYRNNRNENRAAPAGLCYLDISTDETRARGLHGDTILSPHPRRAEIHEYVGRHLRNLRFGGLRLEVSPRPVTISPQMFQVPDLRFGGDRVLSVRATPNTQHVGLDQLGRTRMGLLRDRAAGFYSDAPLDRHYLILPQTVADSFGRQFGRDLSRAVDDLFPQENGYRPIVVPYNDRLANNVVQQGRAVLAAAEIHCRLPGYAVVMLHRQENGGRDEDRLAGLVTRELRGRFDITSAAIHSEVGRECYEQVSTPHGQTDYRIRADRQREMNGYLRVVALNKVLLTNERWPFVLANPLHADVTVGIDVKQNTAGLTIVSGGGAWVSTICRLSRQREMLLAEQVRTYLMELLRLPGATTLPRHIVLHRDGRVWPSERAGARQAVTELSDEGVLAPDATLTILEVSKSAPAPLRLFEVTGGASRPWVENPLVGTYFIAGPNDAYLCATGRPFRHPGTVNPLHIRYVEGGLPFAQALEDLYALTTLAWTRPDDCTREPITIKLNDRRLGEDATEYDADALNFAPGQEGGDAA